VPPGLKTLRPAIELMLMNWPEPAGLEHRQGGGDAVQQALDVDVDHLVPLVGQARRHRGDGHVAGVVDQHVDPAEGLDGGGDHGVGVGLDGDVGPDGDRLAAGGGDLGDQGLQAVDAAGGQHQAGALGGEVAGGGFAQAAAGPGDDDDLAGNVGGHGKSPWLSGRALERPRLVTGKMRARPVRDNP